MTNRQARREQNRSQRGQRPQRGRGGQRPAPRKPQAPGGSGPGSFFSLPYLVGVGALVVILGGLLLFITMRGSDNQLVDQLRAAEQQFPHAMADGLAVGDEDAPISLVTYLDYRCPFCLRFAAEDEPQIIEEYVEAGLVRIETRHLPVLGEGSVIAAEAAQCALRQDAFWQMQHALFIAHAERGTGTGAFSTDAVKGYARDIGLDGQQFDACMDNRDTNEEVQDHRAEAQAFGFTGTPSFLINDAPLTGAPANMEGWRSIFSQLLEDLDSGDQPTDGNDTNGTEDEDAGDTEVGETE